MSNVKKQVLLCLASLMLAVLTVLTGIFPVGTALPDKHTSGQAYRAWESVFFDFDIIQLTFNRDGKYTVIPAVASPIDIVNDITPPVQMPDDTPWWVKLLSVILTIVLVVLVVKLLSLSSRNVSGTGRSKRRSKNTVTGGKNELAI